MPLQPETLAEKKIVPLYSFQCVSIHFSKCEISCVYTLTFWRSQMFILLHLLWLPTSLLKTINKCASWTLSSDIIEHFLLLRGGKFVQILWLWFFIKLFLLITRVMFDWLGCLVDVACCCWTVNVQSSAYYSGVSINFHWHGFSIRHTTVCVGQYMLKRGTVPMITTNFLVNLDIVQELNLSTDHSCLEDSTLCTNCGLWICREAWDVCLSNNYWWGCILQNRASS